MKKTMVTLALCALMSGTSVFAASPRDNFFWLGQINKASAVINTEEGLLTPAEGRNIARGIDKVLKDGNKPGAERPRNVILFEPYLIRAAGPEVTKIHAGRSSQDMLSTVGIMEQREHIMKLAEALNDVERTLIRLAEENKDTMIPNYTNGVAAQPNSLAHYLLAYANAFNRDSQRLQEYYVRLNRSPMGAMVLNGTGWPLDRDRMASYLGFDDIAYNTYDAGQIFTQEAPIETGGITNVIAIHTTSFIEEIMQQYAQPDPWILLKEGGGNTYVSSAMPQKRNPGILNKCRTDASTLLGLSVEAAFRSHNIPAGMADGRLNGKNDIIPHATSVMKQLDQILNNLVIKPERSLEELNRDWTSSQEIADQLMKNYGIPFRVGHHFASDIVTYARNNHIAPSDFSYEKAKEIYGESVKEVVKEDPSIPSTLPMSEEEWKNVKDPIAIVHSRAVKGGPQPSELDKMIEMAKQDLANNENWVTERKSQLKKAEKKLNSDFDRLLAK